jgi:hypothetical protein
MTIYKRRQALASFKEGEQVRINAKRDVDRNPINPDLIYIFIGQNHDYDALVVEEGKEDIINNRQKVNPSKLVKI